MKDNNQSDKERLEKEGTEYKDLQGNTKTSMESDITKAHSMDVIEGMTDEVKRAIMKLTKFQRNYCEYRSKGVSQAQSAAKAGSKAKKEALGRVGYNMEQKEDCRVYLDWLIKSRAEMALVDSNEIIDKARRVFEAAFDAEKYSDSMKAVELLANMGGLLNKGGAKGGSKSTSTKGNTSTKNNVGAFKEEDETDAERLKKIMPALRAVVQDSKK